MRPNAIEFQFINLISDISILICLWLSFVTGQVISSLEHYVLTSRHRDWWTGKVQDLSPIPFIWQNKAYHYIQIHIEESVGPYISTLYPLKEYYYTTIVCNSCGHKLTNNQINPLEWKFICVGNNMNNIILWSKHTRYLPG